VTAARAVFLLLAAGCASTPHDPPAWISSPPLEPGYVHGTGSYVGALYPEDNLGYAMDNARAMLSRSLRSRVVNTTLVRDTDTSSKYSSETLVSTDYVLERSERVATWVDQHGQTGRRGTVWVLMRIPVQ
jgi:hypothetical protein